MDFAFSDEQTMVRATVAAFARERLAPNYTRWDRNDEFPSALWREMGDLGLFGLRVPAEWGGQDGSCLTAGLVMEEVARGDFNLCYGLLNCNLIGDVLAKFASDRIRRYWLAPMARGERVLCVCLTEPHCGSDAAAIRTRAVRRGDGWVLSGEKSAITLLMAGDGAVVFAKTDPGAGAKGVSAFFVPLDAPGITRHPYSDMGARGIVRGSLFLDEVAVPEDALIGPEGGGFSRVMQAFDYTRALIGLMCIGVAEAAIAETIEHLKTRTAFGRPISQNQGASFPVAEAAARLEMGRWLCYRALWLRDQDLPHTREAAMCKMLIPQTAADVIEQCLILHGHYGYTKDFPVEQRLRDVIGQIIADGTPQVMKLIVARDLFGRAFV